MLLLLIFRRILFCKLRSFNSFPVTWSVMGSNVGNCSVVRRAFLWRQYCGAYCSTWWPWQLNNIWRDWSDELVIPQKEMNGGLEALQETTKDAIYKNMNFITLSGLCKKKQAHFCFNSKCPWKLKVEFVCVCLCVCVHKAARVTLRP